MDFEAAMMNVRLSDVRRSCDNEDRVMIHQISTTIDMCEHGNVLARGTVWSNIEHTGRHDVEITRVERELRVEVADYETVMAELGKHRQRQWIRRA